MTPTNPKAASITYHAEQTLLPDERIRTMHPVKDRSDRIIWFAEIAVVPSHE